MCPHTVRKEMKCSMGNQDTTRIVHDNTRKSESHELIHVVSWAISRSISVSPLQYSTFNFFSNSSPFCRPEAGFCHADPPARGLVSPSSSSSAGGGEVSVEELGGPLDQEVREEAGDETAGVGLAHLLPRRQGQVTR